MSRAASSPTFSALRFLAPAALLATALACGGGGPSGTPNGTAPSITTQPASTTVMEFDSVTFNVKASGSDPMAYQWMKDGQKIGGANRSSYTIAMVRSSDAGTYSVTASNFVAPAATSLGATLTVNPYVGPPKILTQPASLTAALGSSASFSVVAAGGTGTFHYAWFKDGQPLAAPDAATFTIASVTTSSVGSYRVRVTNDQGGTDSNLATLSLPAAPIGSFTRTGDLNIARCGHTATLLSDGSVLVVGGTNSSSGCLTSAERFYPAQHAFTQLSSELARGRSYHTATLLPNGTVLIIGGSTNNGITATTEIFTPGAGFTDGPTLATARMKHTATLLPSGKVLVTGGSNAQGAVNTAELVTISTTPGTTASTLNLGRYDHSASLLGSGAVLLCGGRTAPQVYSGQAEWNTSLLPLDFQALTATLHAARAEHTATLLADGSVLIVGGMNSTGPLASIERFDVVQKTFTLGAHAMVNARTLHTATLLTDGSVLLAGGTANLATLSSVEIYRPDGTFQTVTNGMNQARSQHTATLLQDGSLLITGGYSNVSGSITSAEIYR